MEKRFIVMIEGNTMIMCEKHAKVFELAALQANSPHTIYELDDDQAEGMKCMACDLQDEKTRPRIILPGEVF